MEKTILFYDGSCGFCNKTVQFVLKYRTSNSIYFTAQQSEYAQHFFKENEVGGTDLSTVYVWKNGKMYEKSTAALKLLSELNWKLKWMYLGYLLPRFMRDFIYDQIAANRLKIAGEFCYLPNEEERSLFLR